MAATRAHARAGCARLRETLLALRSDAAVAQQLAWPPAAPCALENGLALLLHACLSQESTGAEARTTFAAAIAQQLKTQPEAFKPSPGGAEPDAAAAQTAVWLRLRLLLPLLPIVIGEGQKVGRRCLRETLAAALVHLLALPALRTAPEELDGVHAAAACAAEADAGESLVHRCALRLLLPRPTSCCSTWADAHRPFHAVAQDHAHPAGAVGRRVARLAA
jgi:hypothetical protein